MEYQANGKEVVVITRCCNKSCDHYCSNAKNHCRPDGIIECKDYKFEEIIEVPLRDHLLKYEIKIVRIK